jgi:hypothetical protein
MTGLPLVEGRDCGGCTACCSELAVIELQKPNGTTCQHRRPGGGCAIYKTRFSICRTFHCGWRKLPNLDDSWRPDRSGVMISFETTPGSPYGDDAANLIAIGGDAAALSDHFARLAATFVDAGLGTYFVLPAGPGLVPYNVVLNVLLAESIAARDFEGVKAVIAECHSLMRGQPPVPATAEQLGLGTAS